MARRMKPLTELEKYRMGLGYEPLEYAQKVDLSKTVTLRIERGEPVRRSTLAKYLRGLNVDLNKPESIRAFPGLQIIDVEHLVRVQLTPQ